MGYITAVLTPEERQRAGPKNGAQATATVSLDPLGAVTVHIASDPQGQGHRTVLSQVVADVFGLRPADIHVATEMDTARDAWSIASGNYSSRFAPAVAGATHLAATRLRNKLARIAAAQLNVAVTDLEFATAKVRSRTNPDNAVSFARLAATSHWAPATLPAGIDQAIRETVFWTPPELTAPNAADEVNSSLCHGFIFDICAVEIDPTTAELRIDRYVTMHDCGRILHPGMVAGQITGGFAHALGAATLEEHAYAPDGTFLTGTLADYLVPTAMEVPEPLILHVETPSPFTPLGAKGVGEGNCMSTPVCIANAVADALGLADITLPLLPARLAEHLHGPERQRNVGAGQSSEVSPPAPVGLGREANQGWGQGSAPNKPQSEPSQHTLFGEGSATVDAPRDQIWAMLLDPTALTALIPGARDIQKTSDTAFSAEVTLGIGPVKGTLRATIALSDLHPPHALTLSGSATGALGHAHGTGRITLDESPPGRTTIAYRYEATIGGKVASIGGRLLDGAARVIIGQFFAALAAKTGARRPGILTRLLRWLGRSLHL